MSQPVESDALFAALLEMHKSSDDACYYTHDGQRVILSHVVNSLHRARAHVRRVLREVYGYEKGEIERRLRTGIK